MINARAIGNIFRVKNHTCPHEHFFGGHAVDVRSFMKKSFIKIVKKSEMKYIVSGVKRPFFHCQLSTIYFILVKSRDGGNIFG